MTFYDVLWNAICNGSYTLYVVGFPTDKVYFIPSRFLPFWCGFMRSFYSAFYDFRWEEVLQRWLHNQVPWLPIWRRSWCHSIGNAAKSKTWRRFKASICQSRGKIHCTVLSAQLPKQRLLRLIIFVESLLKNAPLATGCNKLLYVVDYVVLVVDNIEPNFMTWRYEIQLRVMVFLASSIWITKDTLIPPMTK